MERAQIDFSYIKQLIILSLILYSIIFLAMITNGWEDLYNLKLNDNDDYMRYYQFTSWLQDGNWYLKPIGNFNPDQGQIIHWSRLPDIPLAAITLVMKPWLGQHTAEIVAIIFVPFIYLVFLSTALSFFTYRLAGIDAAKLALCMVLLSPLITKFNPGSIDHHNIQLALLAWIIALLPLNKFQAKCINICWLHGLLISLSLWVGMENLPIIAIILLFMTIFGYKISRQYLLYCKQVCISASLFTALFVVVNRPMDEALLARFDAISFICVVLLVSGYIFCSLSIYCLVNKRLRRFNRFLIYSIIAIVSIIPLLTTIPFLISGLFLDYPEILKEFWLNHVIEARSMLEIIRAGGLLDKHNFLMFILPGMLSIVCFYKRKYHLVLYLMMVLLLILPFFWQVRVIYAVFLFAIPVQAILCDLLINKNKFQLVRIFILLVCMPITPILATKTIQTYINNVVAENNVVENESKKKQSNLNKIDLLTRNNVNGSLILAPIEYGAPILALTNNKIVAAPYHRNISGNTIMVEIFSSTNDVYVKQEIDKYKFEYILIGKDGGTSILLSKSDNDAFIHQLNEKRLPQWLSLVEESSSGEILYKVDQEVL